MLHPATPVYEVIIGTVCLVCAFGFTLAVPTAAALFQEFQEEKLRKNNNEEKPND
tara:strand:+ start:1324 stop:1488 length:165 start_codon:yes stop_codon:yes gene_type:complete